MLVQFNPQSVTRITTTRTNARPASVIETIVGLAGLISVAADAYLVWLGMGDWPELTLLSLGLIGLTWVMGNLSPFKGKPMEDNLFTRTGAMARRLAGFGAPVLAAAVANLPQISYRQGAGILAALLSASAIMSVLGKALDLKAALANLAMCVMIAVAVYVLPAPPRSAPPPQFEHDSRTDVKLKIQAYTADDKLLQSRSIGYSCFAILPDTWFTKRPLLYLTVASTAIESEPNVDLPYSPLGYVISAHIDGDHKPAFAEIEITKVLPGESRDVMVKAVGR